MERRPIHQKKVPCLILGQGTYLGFGLDPQSGCAQDAADPPPHPCLSVSLSLPLSLKSINISSSEDFKKIKIRDENYVC